MATSRCGKQRQPLLHSPTPADANGGGAAKRRRFVSFLAVTAALVASYHLLVPTNSSHYHALFLSLGSNATAAAHLRALTLRPHVAGIEANADGAIRRFRRVHITALLVNLAQLAVLVWGTIQLARSA